MFGVFGKVIDRLKLLRIQEVQYAEKLLLEDIVPPQSTKLTKVDITSIGDFYCKYLTGNYETLSGSPIVDDGVSHLRAKLTDGSSQRSLFNDYIDLSLFCTPGRVKSTKSTTLATDPASGNLFYPIEMEYLFAVNSQIQFDVKNDSDVELRFAVTFHGIRRLTKKFRNKV